MISKVKKDLFTRQDLEYQKFHSSLCPGISNIIGVRVPNIRKYVKELLKEDYRFYLDHVENEYYEETLIEGLLIATSKMSLEDKFYYLEKFVPKINCWAICDMISSSFHIKKQDLESFWNFILRYKNSQKEFELRFLIVMMMDYYLIDDYIDKVLKIVDSIQVNYYYTNMAISWLLSISYIKYKEKTLNYLKNNHLSEFTYQKALQKIIESNRVSKREKEIIRKMKKR